MTAPAGETVTITFTEFILENGDYFYDYETNAYDYAVSVCNYDWVEIYEGEGTSGSVLLAKSCGTSVPDPVTSTTNTATLVFYSDSEVVDFGFEAQTF